MKKKIFIIISAVVFIVTVVVLIIIGTSKDGNSFLAFKNKANPYTSTLLAEPIQSNTLVDCFINNQEAFIEQGLTRDLIDKASFYGYDELEQVHMYMVIDESVMVMINVYNDGTFEIVE